MFFLLQSLIPRNNHDFFTGNEPWNHQRNWQETHRWMPASIAEEWVDRLSGMCWFITLPEPVSQYLHSLTLIWPVFTLDNDIPTDCKWKLKSCKAMMFTCTHVSQSYFFITLLLYRYLLIVQGPRNIFDHVISFIVKLNWHQNMVIQPLTDTGVMYIEFRMILENNKRT